MRYFDKNKNIFGCDELHEMHNRIGTACGVVQSNILYKLTHDDDDSVCLAASVYNVIAVCEGLLDKLPDDATAKAFSEVNKDMDEEADDHQKVKALLGILFGGC